MYEAVGGPGIDGDLYWICVAEDRKNWQVLVITILSYWIRQNAGNFWTF
jgi:hypothetical protein